MGGGVAVGSSAQVVGTTVNTGKEVIKGESRIEYVPFEKKILEYKDQAKVERVPKKVKRVEYKEERKMETIPREVTVTDYYAVEYLRQYSPQYVPEKRIEYVQVPKKQVRYEYIPVERYPPHHSGKSSTTPTKPSRARESRAESRPESRAEARSEARLEESRGPDTPPNTEPNTLSSPLLSRESSMRMSPHKENRSSTPLRCRAGKEKWFTRDSRATTRNTTAATPQDK